MDRADPGTPPHDARAAEKLARFHAETVEKVRRAVAEHDVVVVGMAWNPHVPRARRALDAAGIAHHDLDFGSYVTGWKERLAIKIWARWPTFPQVYVKGTLVGGADQVEAAIADGTLKQRLSDARAGTGAP